MHIIICQYPLHITYVLFKWQGFIVVVEKRISMKITGVKDFTFDELSHCTQDFNDSTLIGQGGYGKVYRGVLADGTAVAIKRAQQGSLQGSKEFFTEIELLSRLHHRNLVSLLGYCDEEDEQVVLSKLFSLFLPWRRQILNSISCWWLFNSLLLLNWVVEKLTYKFVGSNGVVERNINACFCYHHISCRAIQWSVYCLVNKRSLLVGTICSFCVELSCWYPIFLEISDGVTSRYTFHSTLLWSSLTLLNLYCRCWFMSICPMEIYVIIFQVRPYSLPLQALKKLTILMQLDPTNKIKYYKSYVSVTCDSCIQAVTPSVFNLSFAMVTYKNTLFILTFSWKM